MRKLLLVVGVMFLSGAAPLNDLLACGDKFLVVGRGSRFQRAALARQPAAILVYMNTASTLPKSLANAQVDETLRKVGYRPTVVTGAAELEAALRQGGWDIILIDLADGTDVRSRVRGEPAPFILPVAYNVSGADLSIAKKAYARVIKGPVKGQALLHAIDDVLVLRPKPAANTLS
jgi:hypothetical protein